MRGSQDALARVRPPGAEKKGPAAIQLSDGDNSSDDEAPSQPVALGVVPSSRSGGWVYPVQEAE
jgi:hypothetical protein